MHIQAERARHRINFLLKQAEIFQHFASDSAVKEAKKCVGTWGSAS